MACNKLLLVALLFDGYVTAGWAVLFFLPSCPIPTSDGASTEELCIPDVDYIPRGTVHFIIACYMGWVAVNFYGYFAAVDEASRAAIARKLLVAAVLAVVNIPVVWAVPVLMPPCSILDLGAGRSCDDPVIFCVPDLPYMPDDFVFMLIGCLIGWVDAHIYLHFTFYYYYDGEEASHSRAAKMAGNMAIRDDPDAGGKI